MKRFINLVLAIAGLCFVVHYGEQVLATTDHMVATAQSIADRG